jgi:hypothetical protein
MKPFLKLLVTAWVTEMQVHARLARCSLQHVEASYFPSNCRAKHTSFCLYCILSSDLEAHCRHAKSRGPATGVASMAAATPLAAITTAQHCRDSCCGACCAEHALVQLVTWYCKAKESLLVYGRSSILCTLTQVTTGSTHS